MVFGENLASKTRTRVFVFESTQMASELLARALERSRYGLQVIGTATSANRSDLTTVAEADVAVISSHLDEGPLAGLTLLRRLADENLAIRCVMLLDQSERNLVVESFAAGALGVCDRSQPYDMLCKCVHSIHLGQVWANSLQLRYVLSALVSLAPRRATDVKGNTLLSKREEEIVSLVAQGLKNREIAETLRVSEHTVKNHLFHIFDKLGISTRAELIIYLVGQKGMSSRLEAAS